MVAMSNLTAAHRGYEYQDLLVACRLVDMMLGTIVRANVDEKLVQGDRFDDLTTVDVVGQRQRTQFKHTEDDNARLTLATFTSDQRLLRLDFLIAAMLADREGPGSDASESVYRVVLRDQPPTDQRLTAVMTRHQFDPGPFLPGGSPWE